MNKKILIVFLVLLLGIAGYLHFGKPEIANSKFIGSWQELALRGGDYHCTYSFKHTAWDGGVGTGDLFVSNDKALNINKSSYPVNGFTFESNILRDGDTLYAWDRQGSPDIAESNKVKFDSSANYKDYKIYTSNEFICEKWTPDPSVFELPSGVSF